jgi:hypothetical protein
MIDEVLDSASENFIVELENLFHDFLNDLENESTEAG